MYEVYNERTNEVVCSGLSEGKAMLKADTLNDRYAMQLIRSGKAPKEFCGIFMIRETV